MRWEVPWVGPSVGDRRTWSWSWAGAWGRTRPGTGTSGACNDTCVPSLPCAVPEDGTYLDSTSSTRWSTYPEIFPFPTHSSCRRVSTASGCTSGQTGTYRCVCVCVCVCLRLRCLAPCTSHSTTSHPITITFNSVDILPATPLPFFSWVPMGFPVPPCRQSRPPAPKIKNPAVREPLAVISWSSASPSSMSDFARHCYCAHKRHSGNPCSRLQLGLWPTVALGC